MGDGEVHNVRHRLVAISDEPRALADDDFGGKHRLNVESDELRQRLAQLSDGDSQVRKDWADRAGRKNSHTPDDDLEAAKRPSCRPSRAGARRRRFALERTE